jgi:hypothetical protein
MVARYGLRTIKMEKAQPLHLLCLCRRDSHVNI